jgi:hypothetical protein
MLMAMPIGVFKVIALIFQRVKRLIFHLPPRSSTPHELKDVARVHAEVRDPTEVLHLVIAHLPVLDEIDPHVWVGGIEGDIIDKAKPMDHMRRAVVPLIIGHTPGVLCCLYVLEQRGMIAFLDTQDAVQTVGLEGRDMGGIGTQTLFGDDAREVRMVLVSLGHKTFRGIAFTIIFVCPIVVRYRLGHERHDGPLGRMEDRGAQHLMRIGDGPIAVEPAETGGAVHRLGRKIPRAIKGQEIMAIKKCHRFQRLASLPLPKDTREHRAEHLGGHRVKDCAHMRVARDPLDPVDGVHIPLGPLLVKSQERGRFEGKHGKGRHERIC